MKNFMDSNFHFLEISAETSFHVGFLHGQKLKNEIHENIQFYLNTFGIENTRLQEMSLYFQKVINEFDNDIFEEIRGIAKGAEIPEWHAFMLNARSEILSNIKIVKSECSLAFFPEQATLFENWDWAKEPGRNTFVLSIEQKGKPKILTITEAGIVVKIGFNSSGVGVGLNFLDPTTKLVGVPIHVLIRKVLDCKTLAEAEKVINKYGTGASGNICIVSENGQFSNFEIDGKNIYNQTSLEEKKLFCHTNHFIGKAQEEENYDFINSSSRLTQISKKHFDENVLFDNSDKENPILQHYIPDDLIGNYGTNASIMIRLKEREMKVKFGLENFEHTHIYKI